MAIRTARASAPDPEESARALAAQMSGIDARLVLFFASSSFEPGAIAAAVARSFPGAETIGCTTAGEIGGGEMLTNSVVALALDRDSLPEMAVVVIEDVSSPSAVPDAFARLERAIGKEMMDLDITTYVGLILIDGLSFAEERIIDAIGDRTNVLFLGGSAGDDGKFERTHVFANGRALPNAAVLALLRPSEGFSVLKTQSFRDTGAVLVATRVDEERRVVYEFNGQPARDAYAAAIAVPPSEAERSFMRCPLGLMVNSEPYVRSPQQFQGSAMVFYCNIKEGMELHLLESLDIVGQTRMAVAEKRREMGGVSGLINFHCILRTLELDRKGQKEEYGQIFADLPAIGFSTYGEQFIGHINQTSTMVLFR